MSAVGQIETLRALRLPAASPMAGAAGMLAQEKRSAAKMNATSSGRRWLSARFRSSPECGESSPLLSAMSFRQAANITCRELEVGA